MTTSLLRSYLDILNEAENQSVTTGAAPAPTAQAPVDPLYQKYNQIRGTLQSYETITGTQPGDRQMQGSIDAGSLAMINKMKADLATAEKQLIAKGYTKQQLDAPFQQKTKSEPLDQNQGWQESTIKEQPTPAAPNTPASTKPAPAAPTAQSKFKLVLPTAAQLKAEYKDVSQVSTDIGAQGSSPEQVQQDIKAYEAGIARYKAKVDNLTKQGNTQAAQIYQKQLDQMQAWLKQAASGEQGGSWYDPDNIGTLDTQRPFAKLVSDVRGEVGAAYKGDGVPKDDNPMSGWESIARAIALPQGQALWLDGKVAFKLMHKLNPWVFKAQPNTPEMAALLQYKKQLPDPETGGPSKYQDVNVSESDLYKQKRSLKEHIEEIENEGALTSGDYFHIELAEDEGIETWVIAEWSESVLIEADAATLKLLEEHGVTFHDELTEAEYQGRKVPLGKRMPGDVKKSKVYVRKPNGKVVKVNFGDKKMKIKKSNPARRKSFRARHNCANPGPRWKARYWSCRAW